jgi:hypothetical protein
VNKVLLTGRLTRDPEMRSLASSKNVTTFTVASNEFIGGGREKAESSAMLRFIPSFSTRPHLGAPVGTAPLPANEARSPRSSRAPWPISLPLRAGLGRSVAETASTEEGWGKGAWIRSAFVDEIPTRFLASVPSCRSTN